jgi:CRP/FNR family transcriptional regulator/CRP/FNR family cyclic AMP-dependent transcriptional regulator
MMAKVEHTASSHTIALERGTVMERENESAYLKQVHIFNSLGDEEISTLAAVVRKRTFRQGEVIFHRDDPGQVLYIIKEGKVKICLISPDGQEISLVVFGKSEYFGELALLDGRPRSADAIALEKVECLALQRSDFQNAIMKHPKIAIRVIEVLCERLRRTDQQVEDLIFLDVYGRVAKKLLELSESHGAKVASGIQIDMRLTQQELASMVGASRESVNKVLGYFTDKKYISIDKHRITIHNIDDLQQRIY